MKKSFKLLFTAFVLLMVVSFTKVEAKDIVINVVNNGITSAVNITHDIPGITPTDPADNSDQDSAIDTYFNLYLYSVITLRNPDDTYYISFSDAQSTFDQRGLDGMVIDNTVNAKIKYLNAPAGNNVVIIGSDIPELNVTVPAKVILSGANKISNAYIECNELEINPAANVEAVTFKDSEINVLGKVNTLANIELDGTNALINEIKGDKLILKTSNVKIGKDSNTLTDNSSMKELEIDENSVLEAETDHNNQNSIPFYTTVTDLSSFKIVDQANTILSTTKDTNNRFVAINSDNSLAKHIFISAKPEDPLTPAVVVDNEECPKTGENTLIYAIVLFGSTCGIIGLRRYKKRLG